MNPQHNPKPPKSGELESQLTGSEELEAEIRGINIGREYGYANKLMNVLDDGAIKAIASWHTKHLAKARLMGQIEELNLAYDNRSLELNYAKKRKKELNQLASMEKTA